MDLIKRYSGDSDEEHDDSEQKALPVPEAIASMFEGRLYHPKPKDEPDSHQGRSRLFEHERGNWATYVYVPCPDMDLVEIVQDQLTEMGLEIIKHPHISLTKTVVLQYHWIQRFINDVKSKLSTVLRFTVSFGDLEVFCNENCSRTFIGFLVHPAGVISQCVDQLDNVLSDYNLPKYYEDPKFHLSVAWCLGDQSTQLRTKLKSLELGIEVDTCRSLRVDKIMCKTEDVIPACVISVLQMHNIAKNCFAQERTEKATVIIATKEDLLYVVTEKALEKVPNDGICDCNDEEYIVYFWPCESYPSNKFGHQYRMNRGWKYEVWERQGRSDK